MLPERMFCIKAGNFCPATSELSLPWRKPGALCPGLGHASNGACGGKWLCCWPGSSHFFTQVTSFLLLVLPTYRDRTAPAVQMRDSPEVQLHHGLLSRAQCSSSSTCTAQSSRDLAFVRASCHCRRSDGV